MSGMAHAGQPPNIVDLLGEHKPAGERLPPRSVPQVRGEDVDEVELASLVEGEDFAAVGNGPRHEVQGSDIHAGRQDPRGVSHHECNNLVQHRIGRNHGDMGIARKRGGVGHLNFRNCWWTRNVRDRGWTRNARNRG